MSPDHHIVSRPSGLVSRRRLLGWSALAAAAGPISALTHPSPVRARERIDETYQRVFQETVDKDPDIRRHPTSGREFLYRPRQLLVAPPDLNRVRVQLQNWGYQTTEGNGFGGVRRLLFPVETDIPSLVSRLRDPRQWGGQPVPLVQPHHVLVGFGNIMGNPGGPPRVAAALPAPAPDRLGEGAGVTVGICDTGIWRQAGAVHPQWLGGSYLPEVDDEDPLYLGGTQLALQGGHGTFVAGVVRQAAPGVQVDPEAALAPTGIGDEESLVAAIGRLGPVDVINLSLGYFTQDDQPPLPVANVIAGLPGRVAVVAAAGNAGTTRRSWPAALNRVVAVAATETGPGGPVPAGYSGRGTWVDACADGDRDSTYVEGELHLPGQPTVVFANFAAWTGTSFSAAHVSGRIAATMTDTGLDGASAAALLLAGPTWHPDFGVLVG